MITIQFNDGIYKIARRDIPPFDTAYGIITFRYPLMAFINNIVTGIGALRARYNVPRLLTLFGIILIVLIVGATLLFMSYRGSPGKKANSSGGTTTQLITVKRPVPFETIAITSSDLPEDAVDVKVPGVDGEAAETRSEERRVGKEGK